MLAEVLSPSTEENTIMIREENRPSLLLLPQAMMRKRKRKRKRTQDIAAVDIIAITDTVALPENLEIHEASLSIRVFHAARGARITLFLLEGRRLKFLCVFVSVPSFFLKTSTLLFVFSLVLITFAFHDTMLRALFMGKGG